MSNFVDLRQLIYINLRLFTSTNLHQFTSIYVRLEDLPEIDGEV